MLLISGAVRPLDDPVGLAERLLDVALLDVDVLEDRVRLFRIEQRLERLAVDRDLDRVQNFAIFVGQQQNRLGLMPDVALDEERLVLLDEVADVAAGHVAIVGDDETRHVPFHLRRLEVAARDRRADGPAMDHPGKGDVVGVERLSGRFADSILAWNVLADSGHSAKLAADGMRWLVAAAQR